MKKTSYILLLFFALFQGASLYGQDDNRILIGAHIPPQAENIPSTAKQLLLDKLGQIVTANGISANVRNSRFILVPKVSVLSKDVLPVAPQKMALNLQITFYVADGVRGNMISSESIMAKGVGSNEIKAYINAFRRINPSQGAFSRLIANSKQEIIRYYDENCTTVNRELEVLRAKGQFREALFLLTTIPESSSCFKSNYGRIRSLYKSAIEQDCQEKLNKAKAIWSSSKDYESALAAAQLLSTVDPVSSCFTEVKALYSKIESRVLEVEDRSWEIELKDYELKKDVISAAREIGVAYGENQPQNVSYDTRGWYD